MNSCDFCKICWQAVLLIGAMIAVVAAMNGMTNAGRNDVCFEAKLDRHHLAICDHSAYPLPETTTGEKL